MKKLMTILILATAVLMTGPNLAYASLTGDDVDLEVMPTPTFPGGEGMQSATVGPGVEFQFQPCFGGSPGVATIDIDSSSIWLDYSLGQDDCQVDMHEIWLRDLDWTGDQPGKIVNVVPNNERCDLDVLITNFGDHEIHFKVNPFLIISDRAQNELNRECHFDIITEHEEPPRVVGGEFLPIDSTALLLAGLPSSAIWMLPILAGVAGAGFYLIKFRTNKE